jgi:hypothetical protein
LFRIKLLAIVGFNMWLIADQVLPAEENIAS